MLTMLLEGVVAGALVLAAVGELYCPTEADFDSSGNIQWHGSGYTMTGPGGVHGKTAFNLLGGYVEFDFDTRKTHGGVNVNLYTISPTGTPGGSNYCDIRSTGQSYTCMEMDIIESNGNCASQATWHTWPNYKGDCDLDGCWWNTRTSGKFRVRAEFKENGWVDVYYGGQKSSGFQPTPSAAAMAYIVETMKSKGASLESSQWKGWAPMKNQCPDGGDLGSSQYTVSNLRVSGSVVQGREPAKCTGPSQAPTPTQTPSPGCCSWNGNKCSHGSAWCDESSGNCNTCRGQWIHHNVLSNASFPIVV